MASTEIDEDSCPGNDCAVEDLRDGYIGPGKSCNDGTRPTPCCTCASGDSTRLGDIKPVLGPCGEFPWLRESKRLGGNATGSLDWRADGGPDEDLWS